MHPGSLRSRSKAEPQIRPSVPLSTQIERFKDASNPLRARLPFRGLIFYPVAGISEHEEFALSRRGDATRTRVSALRGPLSSRSPCGTHHPLAALVGADVDAEVPDNSSCTIGGEPER